MKTKSKGSDVVTKDHLDIRLDELKGEIIREVKEVITENNSAIFSRIDPLLSSF